MKMRTFATMLAMTALATGMQIEDEGRVQEYEFLQENKTNGHAYVFPFAQIEDDKDELSPKDVAMAMIEYNESALIGAKNVIYCSKDQSWRSCSPGTENGGCNRAKVCKSKTGYGTAIVCTDSDDDDKTSIRFCNAGTQGCYNNSETLCAKKPTPPPILGGLKTIKCDKWRDGTETRECHGGTNGCGDNGAACSALQIIPMKVSCWDGESHRLCEYDYENECKDNSRNICSAPSQIRQVKCPDETYRYCKRGSDFCGKQSICSAIDVFSSEPWVPQ